MLMSLDAEKRKQALRMLPPAAVAGIPELQREALAVRQPPMFVNQELVDSRVYRALYSNRQLEEVLVDFWLNHFNVFNGKGPGACCSRATSATRSVRTCSAGSAICCWPRLAIPRCCITSTTGSRRPRAMTFRGSRRPTRDVRDSTRTTAAS
jgi:hypothetical protein